MKKAHTWNDTSVDWIFQRVWASPYNSPVSLLNLRIQSEPHFSRRTGHWRWIRIITQLFHLYIVVHCRHSFLKCLGLKFLRDIHKIQQLFDLLTYVINFYLHYLHIASLTLLPNRRKLATYGGPNPVSIPRWNLRIHRSPISPYDTHSI